MALVVLIGDVESYQSNFNLIEREIIKGNITITATLLTDDDVDYDYLDGNKVIESLDDVEDVEFDYFIVLENNKIWYNLIPVEYEFEQKIIPVRVFEIPHFDFVKYEQLIKNPPTIISRHCWGGLLYNQLGLKFDSPFINLFLQDTDFNKLSKNFSHYMNQELVFDHEEYEHILKINYPVCRLDDIYIYFNHYTSFEEAKQKWDERKKRINYDNLFFETTTENRELALEFDSIPLQHKICFHSGHIDSPDVIDFSKFMENRQPGTLGMLVNHTGNGRIPYFDIIELLLNFNYTPRTQFK